MSIYDLDKYRIIRDANKFWYEYKRKNIKKAGKIFMNHPNRTKDKLKELINKIKKREDGIDEFD